MTNQLSMTKSENANFNLGERTTKFAEEIIKFSKKISNTPENIPIKNQLVKSGTSIGANYCEADEAESRKDFIHKISIIKKETRETKYWLRLIAITNPYLKEFARILWKEARELNLIFAAIVRTAKNKSNSKH